MKTQQRAIRFALAAALAFTSVAGHAQAPANKLPAGSSLPSGQAVGTFTAKGNAVKLTYAAAFVDQTDKAKRVVLLLTDKPVPSAGWKSHGDLMTYHHSTPIVGVVFRIDAADDIDTAEYFIDKFPTSTSGMFKIVFDAKPGKTMSGTLSSSAAAAKMSDAVSANATFNTAVK